MSSEEAQVLLERARCFLENAELLYERGVYDLAAFSLEQYCQLLLKYKLLVYTGTYPRTHSLMRLLRLLARIKPELGSLLEREDFVVMITKIEDAYIGARYLPRRYERKEVEAMLRFAKEVFGPAVEGI